MFRYAFARIKVSLAQFLRDSNPNGLTLAAAIVSQIVDIHFPNYSFDSLTHAV
jgi:hypothetical protein